MSDIFVSKKLPWSALRITLGQIERHLEQSMGAPKTLEGEISESFGASKEQLERSLGQFVAFRGSSWQFGAFCAKLRNICLERKRIIFNI